MSVRCTCASGGDGVVSVRCASHRPAIVVGTVVVGRVSRVAAANVNVDLFAADGVVLDFPARAALRREDVLPAGQDPSTVNLAETFRGSDLVRAVVISTDDKSRYNVAINEPGLGRVVAAPVASGGS